MWLFSHKITFLSTICLLLIYHHHHPSNNKIQEFSFRNISSIKETHTHTYNITIWHIVLFIIFFAYVCLERHSKLHFLYTIREKKRPYLHQLQFISTGEMKTGQEGGNGDSDKRVFTSDICAHVPRKISINQNHLNRITVVFAIGCVLIKIIAL